MSTAIDSALKPARGLLASEGAEALGLHMQLRVPGDTQLIGEQTAASASPVALEMQRTRALEINWPTLSAATSNESALQAWRRALEASWGFRPEIDGIDATTIARTHLSHAAAHDWIYRRGVKIDFPDPLIVDALSTRDQPVPEGALILRHGQSGIGYWLSLKNNVKEETFLKDIADPAAWAAQVERVVPVYVAPPAPPKQAAAGSADETAKPALPFHPLKDLIVEQLKLAERFDDPSRPFPEQLYEIDKFALDLLRSWGIGTASALTQKLIQVDAKTEGRRFYRLKGFRSDAANTAAKQPDPRHPSLVDFEPVPEGHWVIVEGRDLRFHWLKPLAGVKLDLTQLGSQEISPTKYQAMWDQLESTELVSDFAPEPTATSVSHPFTAIEVIDLHTDLLLRQYQDLLIEDNFANELAKHAEELTTPPQDGPIGFDTLEQRLAVYQRFKRRPLEIYRLKESLRRRAQKLSYKLEDVADDPADPKRRRARLTQEKRVRQLVTYTVPKYKHFLGVRYRSGSETRSEWQEFTVNEEIFVDVEPWESRRLELSRQGYECHVVELTDRGYITDNGSGLGALMSRLALDEARRRRTALFIPVYEQRFDTGLTLVKYQIVLAPMPGTGTTALPEFFLEEELSYRTRWIGLELGQLVHSENLAPGESRKISLTRHQKLTIQTQTAIKSVLDVTTASYRELSSALENTIRSEKTRTSDFRASTKGGGSFGIGPWSASAEASMAGSQTTTLKDFAETIRRMAQKATDEMRRREQVEFSRTTTATHEDTQDDTVSADLRNINQGRTLNLLFHLISNVFDAGLFVDRLNVVYRSSRELVVGADLRDLYTIPLSRLNDLLQQIDSDAGGSQILGIEIEALKRHVVGLLVAMLTDEYIGRLQDGAEERPAGERDGRPFVAPDAELERLLEFFAGSEAARETSSQDLAASLAAFCQSLQRSIRPVQSHCLSLPSGAFHLDAVLGTQAATEPYSEEMRARELLMREAEARDKLADADLKSAQAERLRRYPWLGPRTRLAAPIAKRWEIHGESVEVEMSDALPAGGHWWWIYRDVLIVSMTPGSAKLFKLPLERIREKGFDEPRAESLVLVDIETGRYLSSA